MHNWITSHLLTLRLMVISKPSSLALNRNQRSGNGRKMKSKATPSIYTLNKLTPYKLTKGNHLVDTPQSVTNEDLADTIKPVLYIGKFIGLIPIGGLLRKKVNSFSLTCKKYGIGWWITFSVQIMLLVNAVVGFIGMSRDEKPTAADLARSSANTIFYSHGTFIYCYFLRNSHRLVTFFQEWSKVKLHFFKRDPTMARDCFLIAGLIFTSAVLENGILQLVQMQIFDSGNNIPYLESYYRNGHGFWYDVVPYNAVLSVFLFVANKLSLYCWNFTDILIAVCSRAISGRFETLNKLTLESISDETPSEDKLFDTKNLKASNAEYHNFWNLAVKDHVALCHLLLKLEEFLSPLIFGTYSVNIFFCCLQLYMGLSPSNPSKDNPSSDTTSKIRSVYTAWSFTHLILRLFICCVCTANINVHAHRIEKTLEKCPSEYYTLEVDRLERRIQGGQQIGLSGLGCFVLTKPCILSVVGVVFTFEIVLLQSSTPQVKLASK